MRKLFVVLAALALAAAACGNGDSSSPEVAATTDVTETPTPDPAATGDAADETGLPPSGLPPECLAAPFELDVSADAIAGLDGSFVVQTAYAKPQPIVPNPDQGGDGGDRSPEELEAEIEQSKLDAAATDLVLYSMWLADFAFDEGEIGLFGGPEPEPGGTVLGLTIVPIEESGLSSGDVITATDTLSYQTFTTFLPMGSYLLTDLEPDASLIYAGAQTGSAEILYLDENWLCVNWQDAGSTRNPDGAITIAGVITAPLTAREELPFS